jgi:RNA-directed DNA polymerase
VKSRGNLYAGICALENLYAAAAKARKRKTRKEDVERFELHRERFVRQIHEELTAERWTPSAYRKFRIHDPKTRTISAAPYRDRIVHHALCNVIGPLIERRFVHDSYSCRKGKGTLAGRERCRMFTNRYRYALKCDISKYFDSVDHEILFDKVSRAIRCRATLELCRRIIGSSISGETAPAWFPGDDPLAPTGRKRGLPIGNLTSQLWANLYLDRMDHFIREELRVPGYVRYTDDFILWADDKSTLRTCRDAIAQLLVEDRLSLHPVKTRIIPTRTGVPFLGFRFFPARSPRLIGECKRRFERRMRRRMANVRDGRTEMPDVIKSAEGWKAFADYGNTKGLYRQYRAHGFG